MIHGLHDLPADVLTTLTEGERRLKTAATLQDGSGKSAFFTEFGEVTVGNRHDDISINFHYGVSPRETVITATGSGSITQIGSDVAVSIGANAGKAQLSSLDSIRYRAGHEVVCMFTHDQTALESGVTIKHGLVNDEDGIAIGSNGAQRGAWFIEDGNTNFISTFSNGDQLDGKGRTRFNWDLTKRNLIAITFGYLSIAPIKFYIRTNLGWFLFHEINLINQQSEGHLKNPSLPMGLIVERLSGTGSAITAKAGSWRAGSVGAQEYASASDRWFTFTATRTDLAAIDTGANPQLFHNLFSLKSADIFNGKKNHVRAELVVVTFVVDGNKGVEFSSHINGTLVGNSVFNDISAGNSVMSASVSGTVNGNLGGAATSAGKITDRRTDVKGTGIYFRPNSTFSLGARGIDGTAFTGTVTATFRWAEGF